MKVEDNEKMRRLARISAGAARVMSHLVKSIWTTVSRVITSALKEYLSNFSSL